MTQLILTYVSPNEVSLGNTEDIQFLWRSNTYDLPVGSTIFMEDAGTYEIRTIATADYPSKYFNVPVAARVPNDETPGRVVLNRQEEIQRLKASLLASVDTEAENFRHQFITPGSGQSMTYEEKYAEAQAFIADNEIDDVEIPHIVAEIGITGADKAAVAQSIVAMRDQWKALSANIEKIRLGQKKLINDADTVDALTAIGPIVFSVPLSQ